LNFIIYIFLASLIIGGLSFLIANKRFRLKIHLLFIYFAVGLLSSIPTIGLFLFIRYFPKVEILINKFHHLLLNFDLLFYVVWMFFGILLAKIYLRYKIKVSH